MVFVGAHLDSINYGSNLAPGADDNASGSAAVLEAARVLVANLKEDPGVEFRFALFSGEEQGLYGSKAMAKKMAEAGEIERIRDAVILDMIAFDQGGALDVTLESKAFNQPGMDRMAELAALYTSLAASTTTNAWGSDHIPFLNRGVKAILPIEGEYDDNPHDHTGHDVAANLNHDLAAQIMRLMVASLLDSAGIGATP
jgi:Zn-dependent M28 family amino/carboxypeptidase